MRYFLYALSLGLVALMFHSCDSCFGVSCKDNENYREILRIVSARDGSHLVFGGNRLYQREKIRFFSVKGRDTTFLEQRALRLTDNAPDSALLVNFSSKADTAFMQLTPADIDTLLVAYSERNVRCCVFNVVSSLRYNNSSDTLRQSPHLLRK